MKLVYTILVPGTILLFTACGNSYEKSPEDWSAEMCDCIKKNGGVDEECKNIMTQLKSYYADEDYDMHDKATTLIGQDCPEGLM